MDERLKTDGRSGFFGISAIWILLGGLVLFLALFRLSGFFIPHVPVQDSGADVSAFTADLSESAPPAEPIRLEEVEQAVSSGRQAARRQETSEQVEQEIKIGLEVSEIPSHAVEGIRILTPYLEAAHVGEFYRQKIDVNREAGPLSFRLLKGFLAAGLRLDEQRGIIFGRAEEGRAGEITVEVEDSFGRRAARDFILVARTRKTQSPGGPLSVKEADPFHAVVGHHFFFEIPAAGGEPPFSFRIASGEIPNGTRFLEKEGILFGRLEHAGRYTFDVEIGDVSGASALGSYEVTVKDSPLYLMTPKLPEGYVGQPYSAYLEAQGGFPPYRWKIRSGKIPNGIRFSPEYGMLTGTPVEKVSGKVILSVEDGQGNFDSAELYLKIQGGELAIPDQKLEDGVVGGFYYAVFSAQGGRPPYRWSLNSTLPDGLKFDEESGTLWSVPLRSFSESLSVSVKDSSGHVANAEIELRILEFPLTLELPASLSVSVGESFYYFLECRGGIPPYTWQAVRDIPDGLWLNEKGNLIGAPEIPGKFLTQLKVTDRAGESVAGLVAIWVREEELAITTHQLPEATYAEPYYARLEASGGNIPYRWHTVPGNFPEGLELTSSGVLQGAPGESGEFALEIFLEDTRGKAVRAEIPLFVLHDQLKLTTETLPQGYVQNAYHAQIEALGGHAPYSWDIISGGLPGGLALDSKAGAISGAPLDGGKVDFEVRVQDYSRRSITGTFSILIEGEALNIPDTQLARAFVSKPYQFVLSAEDGIPPYRWETAGRFLPGSIQLDSSTGLLAGTADRSGEFMFTARVFDQAGREASRSLSLHVDPEPLAITSSEMPHAILGTFYEFRFSASGGESPYVWNLVNSTLPEGLRWHEEFAQIDGVPAENVLDHSITARVSDAAGGAAEHTFLFTVEGERPAAVHGLILASSDGKAGLVWRIPNDSTVVEIRVYRSETGWPDLATDVPVYAGMDDQWVDDGLENGVAYRYAAVAANAVGILSDIEADSKGEVVPQAVRLQGPADPFADQVVLFQPLAANGYGSSHQPANVLGAPSGGGDFAPQISPAAVLSLHAKSKADSSLSAPCGGSIVLEFSDNIILNGPGTDFIVFENAFFVAGDISHRFMEPAVVAVGQNGVRYYQIPFDYVRHLDSLDREVTDNPYSYASGFAGIEPVYSSAGIPDPTNPFLAGGDRFDLSWIRERSLKWIRFVKITATGDECLADSDGDPVRHVSEAGALGGAGNSGFDLDAVSAVHY